VPAGLFVFSPPYFSYGECNLLWQKPLYLLALLMVPLLGACAFLPDQWGRNFRFLADRGVRPKHVWWSRQLAIFLPLLLSAAFLFFIALAFHTGHNLFNFHRFHYSAVDAAAIIFGLVVGIFGYAIVAVAAGQFCSMFFRSSLLAGLFSIVLTVVLAAWCWLMWFWSMPWYWSMLPIPVALLLATRLRTADWL